jgi:hypothetical protein
MAQTIIDIPNELIGFLNVFKQKRDIKDDEDAINQIVKEYKIMDEIENLGEMTENDVELFKITNELDKLGYFGTEKDLEKYGIKL